MKIWYSQDIEYKRDRERLNITCQTSLCRYIEQGLEKIAKIQYLLKTRKRTENYDKSWSPTSWRWHLEEKNVYCFYMTFYIYSTNRCERRQIDSYIMNSSWHNIRLHFLKFEFSKKFESFDCKWFAAKFCHILLYHFPTKNLTSDNSKESYRTTFLYSFAFFFSTRFSSYFSTFIFIFETIQPFRKLFFDHNWQILQCDTNLETKM